MLDKAKSLEPEDRHGKRFDHVPGGLHGDTVTWITHVDAPALWSHFTHELTLTRDLGFYRRAFADLSLLEK